MSENVLAFAGSTREDSVNKKLIKEAVRIAKNRGASVTLIDLRDFTMPLYDGDLEAKSGRPEMATKLRQLMSSADTIIISTPEYNGSLPAVLKNAIDWTSRSIDGKSDLTDYKEKRFILLSASPGRRGGARSLSHLKQILEGIGADVANNTFSLPEAYGAFDELGHLKAASLQTSLSLIINQINN